MLLSYGHKQILPVSDAEKVVCSGDRMSGPWRDRIGCAENIETRRCGAKIAYSDGNERAIATRDATQRKDLADVVWNPILAIG